MTVKVERDRSTDTAHAAADCPHDGQAKPPRRHRVASVRAWYGAHTHRLERFLVIAAAALSVLYVLNVAYRGSSANLADLPLLLYLTVVLAVIGLLLARRAFPLDVLLGTAAIYFVAFIWYPYWWTWWNWSEPVQTVSLVVLAVSAYNVGRHCAVGTVVVAA